MDAPRTLPEQPRTEDVQVFVALAVPIFAVSALIIAVILALGTK
jgi:hypothetical protein